MHLDRDEFTVVYNSSQITTDALIQTIKDTGYTARIVTGELESPIEESTSQIPTDLEPLATTIREAMEKQKPILLDFHAAWCAPCRRMETETFTNKEVAALLDRYVVLKIDTDEHTKLSESFGVTGLPDIRLLSANGQRQKQLQGFQTVDAIIPELETFLDGSKR